MKVVTEVRVIETPKTHIASGVLTLNGVECPFTANVTVPETRIEVTYAETQPAPVPAPTPTPEPPPTPTPIPPVVIPGTHQVRTQADFMLLRTTRFNPGATILMYSGDYSLDNEGIQGFDGTKFKTPFRGNEQARIVLQAAPGEHPRMRTSTPFYGCSYLNIIGLSFVDGGGLSAIDADWIAGKPRSHHVTIASCEFRGPQKRFGFIQLRGDDLAVINCTIASEPTGGQTTDHGIYIHAGKNILIDGCDVQGVSGYCYHFYEENRLAFDNIEMRYCIGSGSRQRSGMICSLGSGGDGSVAFKLAHFHHNQFFGNKQAGAEFTTYGAPIEGPIMFGQNVLTDNPAGIRNTSDKPIGLTVKQCQLPPQNSTQGGIVYLP